MAVDFASKQRDRAGAGWGLRNAKLRMSRKLIFASGLLICFSANLDPDLQKKISTETSTGNDAIKLNLVNYIRELVRLTPLETLDRIVKNCDVSAQTAEQLFSAYAEFLSMLGDEATRNALDALRAKDSRTDKAFQRIRKISEQFEVALSEIFFGNPRLAPLTRKYGVF
jgi:hypothetical protein